MSRWHNNVEHQTGIFSVCVFAAQLGRSDAATLALVDSKTRVGCYWSLVGLLGDNVDAESSLNLDESVLSSRQY